MIKLAANLSTMFTELPFADRFAAAAQAGFEGIEYLFPYELAADVVAHLLATHGLTQTLFNLPAGDWAAGARGIAALPDRVDEFRRGVAVAHDYARATGCPRLHIMPGIVANADDRAAATATFLDNIVFAADAVAADGIEIMLEPINDRVDMPGYLLTRTDQAIELIARSGRPNVKLQYDAYHMQIMEGDLARRIEQHLPMIAHIQIAENPGRNEPGNGEVNWPWLLNRIDALGYDGWIGCEYRPADDTVAGLGWAASYLAAAQSKRNDA